MTMDNNKEQIQYILEAELEKAIKDIDLKVFYYKTFEINDIDQCIKEIKNILNDSKNREKLDKEGVLKFDVCNGSAHVNIFTFNENDNDNLRVGVIPILRIIKVI